MTAAWFDASPSETLLWDLLPRFYQRGSGHGDVLGPLVTALAESYSVLRADLAEAYDDLFVETCRPALIPVIAADLGLDRLPSGGVDPVADRRWVAATCDLRRRRGTPRALADACRLATGFAVEVTPPRPVLAAAPFLATGLGDPLAPEAAVEMRAAAIGSGARPGDIGFPAPGVALLSVWRVPGRRVVEGVPGRPSEPERDGPGSERRRTFDPSGGDSPLLDAPRSGTGRPATIASWPADSPPPCEVRWRRAAGEPTVTASPVVTDLRAWRDPGLSADEVAVDPERGRLLLPDASIEAVTVDWTRPDVGIGAGSRRSTAAGSSSTAAWAIAATDRQAADAIARAFAGARADGAVVTIEIAGDALVPGPAQGWEVVVGAGAQVDLQAAASARPVLGGPCPVRFLGPGVVRVRDVVLTRGLTVRGGGIVVIENVTCPPGATPSLDVRAEHGDPLVVMVASSMIGAVVTAGDVVLGITDSVVDGRRGNAVTMTGEASSVRLHRATALGDVLAPEAVVLDSLVLGTVHTQRPPSIERSSSHDASGVRPVLISRRFGALGYGRLHPGNPSCLLEGNEDGQEVGAFGRRWYTARQRTLAAVAADFVPVGWDVAVRVCS